MSEEEIAPAKLTPILEGQTIKGVRKHQADNGKRGLRLVLASKRTFLIMPKGRSRITLIAPNLVGDNAPITHIRITWPTTAVYQMEFMAADYTLLIVRCTGHKSARHAPLVAVEGVMDVRPTG